MVNFYDTNALLTLGDKLVGKEFYISSVSLHELENIKTSKTKIEEIRYKAREVTRILEHNTDSYVVVTVNSTILEYLDTEKLEHTPDNLICACAKYVQMVEPGEPVLFYTSDLCCKAIARSIFGLTVAGLTEDSFSDDYSGYVEKIFSDTDLADLYTHLDENKYGLLQNEYLIVKDAQGSPVDQLKWTGSELLAVPKANIKTAQFGVIKPYKSDVYQICAINCMSSNQISMLKGPAGTGKSYLALGYLMYALEQKKIDKIIVFTNPQPTANAARLGFYPGTRLEKLLESNIGNMLASKLGDIEGVNRLTAENKLVILPMCDIRGYDTTGMQAGIYIPEAQNMDINLMKLALQRIGADSICIIDGDYNAQTDLPQYQGSNNGMRRVSEVFRGQDFYGEVELKNIYRSRIAEIAERM